MRPLLRIAAGVIAVDVVIVAGLWLWATVTARRARRPVGRLEPLSVVTAPTRGHRRPAGSWRVAAVLVAAAVGLWGSVVTNQQARHVIASALGTATDGASAASGPLTGFASPTNGPSPQGAAGAPQSVQVRDAHEPGAGPPPVASAGDAAPTPGPGTAPVEGPPTVLGIPSSTTAIQVAWSDVSGENGYRVERSREADAGWVQVATTMAGVTSYVDDGLAPGTTYYYRVFATTTEGDSPPSDVVSATTAAPPGTPIDVVAIAGDQNEIDLSWGAVQGATGYRLERSPDGLDGWAPIATTGQDVTIYADTGLTSKTTYFYRVVAVSPYGDGPPSAVVQATTSGHPLGNGEQGNGPPGVTD